MNLRFSRARLFVLISLVSVAVVGGSVVVWSQHERDARYVLSPMASGVASSRPASQPSQIRDQSSIKLDIALESYPTQMDSATRSEIMRDVRHALWSVEDVALGSEDEPAIEVHDLGFVAVHEIIGFQTRESHHVPELIASQLRYGLITPSGTPLVVISRGIQAEYIRRLTILSNLGVYPAGVYDLFDRLKAATSVDGLFVIFPKIRDVPEVRAQLPELLRQMQTYDAIHASVIDATFDVPQVGVALAVTLVQAQEALPPLRVIAGSFGGTWKFILDVP